MYDREGQYQAITPIDSEGFEPRMINPRETADRFHVTQVADDSGNRQIVEKTIELERQRHGTLPEVNYGSGLENAIAPAKPFPASGDSIAAEPLFSISKSTEEFDRILEKAKEEHGIVAPNLANRMVR